jgi:hypothetical protein
LGCLRKYPMRDDEVIEEMKCYLAGPAQKGMYKKGLVDLRRLSEFAAAPECEEEADGSLEGHDIPEFAIFRAQEELYRMVFSAEQRENHKIDMDLDYGSALTPELKEEGLPSTAVYPTFTLPLRLGAPTFFESVPGPFEQQYDSGHLLAQAREDDMRMRFD